MCANQNTMNFDTFMPIYNKFRKAEKDKDVDMEPFAMPLFSSNPAKRYVVLAKYRAITKYLLERQLGDAALDFGTGFGAFLPILSSKFYQVIAVDAFDDQVTAARDLVTYMKLPNVRVEKVRKDNGLSYFNDGKFDTVLATDVLEHNLNYKDIVMELKRLLKPGGLLIVSLPREHLLYRLFARREVEHNEERGHVYHSSRGADLVEEFITKQFRVIERVNAFSFIHVLFLQKFVT